MTTVAGALVGSSTGLSVKPITDLFVLNHVTDPAPNTETSFVTGTIKRFTLFNEGTDAVKVTYAAGQSGTLYKSIKPNGFYGEDGIDDQSLTFYVQSSAASQRLEIVCGL